MKRYKMTNDYGCGYGVTPEENPQGEWVKYEDAEKIASVLLDLVKDMKILYGDGTLPPSGFGKEGREIKATK